MFKGRRCLRRSYRISYKQGKTGKVSACHTERKTGKEKNEVAVVTMLADKGTGSGASSNDSRQSCSSHAPYVHCTVCSVNRYAQQTATSQARWKMGKNFLTQRRLYLWFSLIIFLLLSRFAYCKSWSWPRLVLIQSEKASCSSILTEWVVPG